MISEKSEQRLRALEIANKHRNLRAKWKVAVADQPKPEAYRAAARMVGTPPPWARTFRVLDLLRALPRVGKSESVKIARSCKIYGEVGIHELTPGKREALIETLIARADRFSREEGSA